MIVNTPFFISPAYCVPRMTNSPVAKFSATLVEDATPSTLVLAAALPAL